MTEEGFLRYYNSISATVPVENDDYFVNLILDTWGMPRNYVSPDRVNSLLETFYEKVRQRTHGNDDEGKTLLKTFRYFDSNGNGAISLKEFSDVLVSYGCIFTPQET